MPKIHSCLVKIYHNSGINMSFLRDWYDSGRIADRFSWPKAIADRSSAEILNYEKDWSMAGCSGYVTYAMGGTEVTVAFSNPSAGRNKFGVGITGKEVWNEMSDHGYDSFNVLLTVADKKLLFRCKCTGSSTNECTVNIESDPDQILTLESTPQGESESAVSVFCTNAAKKLRDKYDGLLNLPYSSMSGKLFAKEVITSHEKQDINHLVPTKQMEKVVDIVIFSLNGYCTAKYKGFLKAMEESDDLLLQSKAKELGGSESVPN